MSAYKFMKCLTCGKTIFSGVEVDKLLKCADATEDIGEHMKHRATQETSNEITEEEYAEYEQKGRKGE